MEYLSSFHKAGMKYDIIREWHGNGECDNTAVTAVITVGMGRILPYYRGDRSECAVLLR